VTDIKNTTKAELLHYYTLHTKLPKTKIIYNGTMEGYQQSKLD